MERAEAAAGPTPGPRDTSLGIFWISALALYLELLLIRWIGTEIRIFAYLQNAVLVVCFLGFGTGLLTARRPVVRWRPIASLLLLVGLLVIPVTRRGYLQISGLLGILGDLNIWGASFSTSPWVVAGGLAAGLAMTYVVMVLVVDACLPIGRVLGRLMDAHPSTIEAYSINVAGSLAGVWLFVGLSRLSQPPLAWFAVLVLLLVPWIARPRRWPRSRPRRWPLHWPPLEVVGLAGILALAWLAGRTDGALRTVWSPYQKLTLTASRFGPGPASRGLTIDVNNMGYQDMADLRPETLRADPGSHLPGQIGLSQYDLPFLFRPGARSALIVGAGAGNDAAGAIRQGVPRITAVEIDPAIIELGRRYHPERPYDSERVRVVIDDARSFFATTTGRYDVIAFGLLDSHSTTAMTNARLDHYVYTRESLGRARELLASGGVLTLTFDAFRPFMADRLAAELRAVFGEAPLVFRVPRSPWGGGGVMFVAGDLRGVKARLARSPRLAGLISGWQAAHPVAIPYVTPPATDDWPYVYLKGPRIPFLFGLLAGLTGLLALQARRLAGDGFRFGVRHWSRSNWHFFFLGAAFLLLEVQNISKAAVVLGNTWLVNAVIISGVLAMVLLANLIAARWPGLPLGPVYVALLAAPLALYFVDLARFAFLAYPLKAALVGSLTTLPMLFGGIVFIRSFARTEERGVALGANLLGALVGGLLQSVSFLVGIKALLLLVAALYGAALLLKPRGERPAGFPVPARTAPSRV